MTSQFHPPDASALKGKVVVLTGGALGVGSCIVRDLHAVGAHVVFGDVLTEPGKALEQELSKQSTGGSAKFVHCDVTSYQANLTLFSTAYEVHGRVDHAIANAGLGEQGTMFDPNLTLESVKEEPKKSMNVVEVNLKGPLYFARCASVYLRQGEGGGDKSLTLLSSVAGFREDPGLYVYTATKHGVLGLMRSLRVPLSHSKPSPIRTNAICPWMTRTRLAAGIDDIWHEAGLASNTADNVAKIIVGVLSDSSLSGGTFYIEGGRGWNVEQGLLKTRPEWLGEQRARDLDRGSRLMGGGDHWTDNKSSQV